MVLTASTVLTLDAVATCFIGLALYFAPDKCADFMFNRTTDGVHWHLVRCVGGHILSCAFFLFRFRRRAPETQTTCFSLRIMICIFTLLLAFNTRSTNPDLVAPEYLQVIIYGSFAVIAVYAFLVVRSRWPVGTTLFESHSGGNGLYQLDSMAAIVIGMAWIACPQWLLHRQVKVSMDASHDLCARFMGALFVASYIVSAHALHWKQQRDRSVAAECRTVCCLCILGAQVWSQMAYERDWSGAHWVGISLFSTWTVIAIIYRLYIFFAIGNDDAGTGKKRQ